MLTVLVGAQDFYDDSKKEFTVTSDFVVKLEHSLVSLSKWESKWEIPFLSANNKTEEQLRYYIEAMTVTPNVPPEIFQRLFNEHMREINTYISAKMTATWFTTRPDQKPSREIITAELIYYWMIAYNIPVEFQYWHLNKLLTLIKVCNHKNAPAKKMSKAEAAQQRSALNAQRKAQMSTRG